MMQMKKCVGKGRGQHNITVMQKQPGFLQMWDLMVDLRSRPIMLYNVMHLYCSICRKHKILVLILDCQVAPLKATPRLDHGIVIKSVNFRPKPPSPVNPKTLESSKSVFCNPDVPVPTEAESNPSLTEQ